MRLDGRSGDRFQNSMQSPEVAGSRTRRAARRLWIAIPLILGLAFAASMTARALRASAARQDQAEMDQLVQQLKSGPPLQPPRVGTLAPYRVAGQVSVHESGGPESASRSFVDDETGLDVRVDIHLCHPISSVGELNLIDGSDVDDCTSGGSVTLNASSLGGPFEIRFKLLGTPNGAIFWDARELAVNADLRERLVRLRSALESSRPVVAHPPALPTVHDDQAMISTSTLEKPPMELIRGRRDEMLRLFSFRQAFRDFYQDQAADRAKSIAWLMVDSLLQSPEQEQMTRRWQEFAQSAGGPAHANGPMRPLHPSP